LAVDHDYLVALSAVGQHQAPQTVSSAGTARSGSYPDDPAAIIGSLPLGVFMACTDRSLPNATDHGVGNRREENLHAQLLHTRPAALYGLPRLMLSNRITGGWFQSHELAGGAVRGAPPGAEPSTVTSALGRAPGGAAR